MIIKTEEEMIDFGRRLGKTLKPPLAVELIGDVGVGKTTLVKGLAKGLGLTTPVTSPSFTINKIYGQKGQTFLSHYDFYRLADPGIMADDLAESLADPNTITVVEWGETVKNLLPENRLQIMIAYRDDGSRLVEIRR